MDKIGVEKGVDKVGVDKGGVEKMGMSKASVYS